MQETADFSIAPRKRKELLTQWKALKSNVKNEVVRFKLDGLKLVVVGSANALYSLRHFLKPFLFQGLEQKQKDNAEEEECDICFCELEQPYYYRVREHGGCTSCLVGQFSLDFSIPIKCFSDGCGKCDLALSDITALAPSQGFSSIKEAAVNKYVREHPRNVQFCPSPGCNQVLDLTSVVTPASDNEEAKRGGVVARCDQCSQKYCLTCSERDGKPVNFHFGECWFM